MLPAESSLRTRADVTREAVTALNNGDREGFTDLLARMRANGIHELDFSHQVITDVGMRCLAAVVEHQLTSQHDWPVRKLDFSQATIASPAALMSSLARHKGGMVEELSFAGARELSAGQGPLPDQAWTDVGSLLARSKSLRVLNLSGQPLGGASLAEPCHTTFEYLMKQLGRPMGDASKPKPLETLVLQDCGLLAGDQRDLKSVLPKLPCLKQLDISGNDQLVSLDDEASLQAFNSLLRRIAEHPALDGVVLPDAAADCYATALDNPHQSPIPWRSTTLRHLDPAPNATSAGEQALVDCLHKNRWTDPSGPAAILCIRERFIIPRDLEMLLLKKFGVLPQ